MIKQCYEGWGQQTGPYFEPLGLTYTSGVRESICRSLQVCWVTVPQLYQGLPALSEHGHGAGNAFGNRV